MTSAVEQSPSTSAVWGYTIHPETWALVLLLVALYAGALRRFGPRYAPAGEPIATTRQKASFMLGIAAMWIASDYPIDNLSDHYLFSIHMVQHLIYMLVVPPLLIWGMPKWLLRLPLERRPGLRRAAKTLARPWVGLAFFNVMIVLIHWPLVVDWQLKYELFHLMIHVAIVVSAVFMWWPVVSPLPELTYLSEPGKMLYLFLQSVIPTIPASFLTFSRTPIYHIYTTFPRAFGLSHVTDQMIAGLTMKIGGGLLLWTVIGYIFFTWYAREERETETITWHEFEQELEAFEMRK